MSARLQPPPGSEGAQLDTGLWMVPYADLMSNLMILFLAMFAYSYAAQSAERDRVPKEVKGLKLKEMGVSVTAKYVSLTLPAPILFGEGSDQLSTEGERALAPIARLLAALPNPVLVAGHTDDRPIRGGRHKTNWELSAARAFAVIDYFKAAGIPPERFRARGYGEFRPVGDNATPAGRSLNRRIELSIVREAGFP